MRPHDFADDAAGDLRELHRGSACLTPNHGAVMPVMTMDNHDHPTAREILDAVLHAQGVLAGAIGRLKGDVDAVKRELEGDVLRLERRVIRMDDRLSSIESLRLQSILDDHERRIARLEGF